MYIHLLGRELLSSHREFASGHPETASAEYGERRLCGYLDMLLRGYRAQVSCAKKTLALFARGRDARFAQPCTIRFRQRVLLFLC